MSKTALITGITGQDGSYLAEYLLSLGYKVCGLVRRSSTETFQRISHFVDHITLLHGDLLDQTSLIEAVAAVKPQEVYNLAAQSFVPASWEQPVLTAEFTALGVTRVLEAIKQVDPSIRFYQASSSEMFGKVQEVPQSERTPFYPRSPYGVAKVYGHWITVNYRESYGMHANSGILFNHESPRRGTEFVTRKISLAAARISAGLQAFLRLGNMDTKRDWGYAGDYVKAMHLMLQANEPGDYVIATEETHTVREFCETAFSAAGIEIAWEGTGLDEAGYVKRTGQKVVIVDPQFYRPAEVQLLVGDATKARTALGWSAETGFGKLVDDMVAADMELVRRG